MYALALIALAAGAQAHYGGNHGYDKPVYPEPVYPQPVVPVVPPVYVTPVAPGVTVTVTESTSTPAATSAPPKKPKKNIDCATWTDEYENDCDEDLILEEQKCTLKKKKHYSKKWPKCEEKVCCPPKEDVPAPAAVYTVVECAQFCSQSSLQCQVAVAGSCALEGAFGQYSQCSQELCCAKPVPVIPEAEIISCSRYVSGRECGLVADYGCSLNGASGRYPACSYNVCCLNEVPDCSGCKFGFGSTYCPPECQVPDCSGCKFGFGSTHCPPECQGNANSGYESGKYY